MSSEKTAAVNGTKDVEMKDVEEKKAEEPDPKQVQKDKDLLTFEGKVKIPFNAHRYGLFFFSFFLSFSPFFLPRHTRADEVGRERGEPEGAQVHP